MVCYLGRVCLTYICTRSALDRTLTTCITASLIRLTRCQRLGAFESTTSRLLMFNRSLLAPEVLLGVDSNARCVLRSDRALFELVHFNQIVAHAQPPFCWTASHTLLITQLLWRSSCKYRFSCHTEPSTALAPSRISAILNMTRSEAVSSNAPSQWQRVKRPNQPQVFSGWLYSLSRYSASRLFFNTRLSALDSAGMDPSRSCGKHGQLPRTRFYHVHLYAIGN